MRGTSRQVYSAFAVFGLTVGLYAGWSQSPVVGPLLSGLLGLVAGGAITILTGQRKEGAKDLSPEQLRTVSTGIIVLCALSVTGTVFGACARVVAIKYATSDSPSLMSIARVPDIPPEFATRLLLVQHALSSHGVNPEDNDAVITAYLDKYKSDAPSARVAISYLSRIKSFLGGLKDADQIPDIPEQIKNVLNNDDYGYDRTSVAVTVVGQELERRASYRNSYHEDIDTLLRIVSYEPKDVTEKSVDPGGVVAPVIGGPN